MELSFLFSQRDGRPSEGGRVRELGLSLRAIKLKRQEEEILELQNE